MVDHDGDVDDDDDDDKAATMSDKIKLPFLYHQKAMQERESMDINSVITMNTQI